MYYFILANQICYWLLADIRILHLCNNLLGEPSDTEKLSIDNKPQIMDCPQFIHSINDAVNTNHVSHIQSEVDRSCQVPLTVTEGEITVSLANSDMWRQFDTYGTEMVLTKRGRYVRLITIVICC